MHMEFQDAVKGNGDRKAESRPVTSFDRVVASVAADYEVVCGKAPSLHIEADSNLLKEIETKVQGNTLRIGSKSNLRSEKGIKVVITTTSLNGFDISGAGAVKIAGARGKSLDISVSGAADVTATGQVDKASMTISGAGSANLSGLQAKVATVEVSGAGDIQVWATEDLKAEVSGAGSVKYKGNPKVDWKKNGAGSIEKMD